MSAEPTDPIDRTDVQTIRMLAARINARGYYCAAFGEDLATLNGVCARIFQTSDPGPTASKKSG